MEISFDSRSAFFDWLPDHVDRSQAEEYRELFDRIDSLAKRNCLISDDLLLQSVKDLPLLRDALTTNAAYRKQLKTKQEQVIALLKLCETFLTTLQTFADAWYNVRSYRQYLRAHGQPPAVVDGLTYAILLADEIIRKYNLDSKPLSEAKGAADAARAYNELSLNKRFQRKNEILGNALYDAVLLFCKMMNRSDKLEDPAKEQPLSAQSVDLSDEVSELLAGQGYAPLREALIREGITTLEQLKATNLWLFMNGNNLYNIARRNEIFRQLQDRLHRNSHAADAERYVLTSGALRFYGATPAEAFCHLCTEMARLCKLAFSKMILRPSPWRNCEPSLLEPPIFAEKPSSPWLQIGGVNAYIYQGMSAEEALIAANQVATACFNEPVTFELTDAQPPAPKPKPAKPAPKPKPAQDKPADPVKTSRVESIEAIVLKADTAGVTLDDLQAALLCTAAAAKEAVS